LSRTEAGAVTYRRDELSERRIGMRTVGFTLAALLVAFVLIGAGCGGDDDSAGDTTTTETTETDTTETDTTGTETETTPSGTALKGSVGPGFVISLSTEDGDPVEALEAGSYELELEDLSSAHNFHLTGTAVDISTDVGEEGTQNLSIDLQPGTYNFVCDPHAGTMNGSFTVS
jgi:hypothetical protein